jgi:hypothetical protein
MRNDCHQCHRATVCRRRVPSLAKAPPASRSPNQRRPLENPHIVMIKEVLPALISPATISSVTIFSSMAPFCLRDRQKLVKPDQPSRVWDQLDESFTGVSYSRLSHSPPRRWLSPIVPPTSRKLARRPLTW